MSPFSLHYSLNFIDLYTQEGLLALDTHFLCFLNEELSAQLQEARRDPPSNSRLILDLAPVVEDFLTYLFHVEQSVGQLQAQHHALAPLARCKRLFIQRQAAKAFSHEETRGWDGASLKAACELALGFPFNELGFSQAVLAWMAENNLEKLDIARRYVAWRVHHDPGYGLFCLPKKIDENGRVACRSRTHQNLEVLEGDHAFDIPPLTRERALDQSCYCLICHNQGKDFCRQGLPPERQIQRLPRNGCPLGQKISEMNALRNQGLCLGALAVIMIDNPLVAATGHRICNDCEAACIFQKQTPVDVPSIETQTLLEVLGLPWGFEIYSLLSRWNPLNFAAPLPAPPSGYTVLVAGQGPAGFTLAHYLLNAGHQVVAIDGLKIEPLNIPFEPIQHIQDYFASPETRAPSGFGGVAAYGITQRWDKNFLLVIRLLLERRSAYTLLGSVRLGSQITVAQAFEQGIDHVALCLGTGQPHIPPIPGLQARGVRTALDFLMALHLGRPEKEDSLSSLQIRLPIAVIGGGLTAVDAATEALAYYPKMVEKFLKFSEEHPDISFSDAEKPLVDEFQNHARLLWKEKGLAARENRQPKILEMLQSWGGCTIVYRKSLVDSPAYALNAAEVSAALKAGVFLAEDQSISAVVTDELGDVAGIRLASGEVLPCRTLLIATGSQANTGLADDEPAFTRDGTFLQRVKEHGFQVKYPHPTKSVSIFGDSHPHYAGSVVKAMASAKEGIGEINTLLHQHPPCASDPTALSRTFKADLQSTVKSVTPLNQNLFELVIQAPAAARQFRPGHLFRLQSFPTKHLPPSEGIPLTGIDADTEHGTLSFVMGPIGASSLICTHLAPGEPVSLMGPTGNPMPIPYGETVLLMGAGGGNAALFAVGKALRAQGNKVFSIAGFSSPKALFKMESLADACDILILCCDQGSTTPPRLTDHFFSGNPIQALQYFKPLLNTVSHLFVNGSPGFMGAIHAAKDSVLAPHHTSHGTATIPMQCMMKKVCGQCLQVSQNPNGVMHITYACAKPHQALDQLISPCIRRRLTQNSLLERVNLAHLKKELGCIP